MRVVWRDSSAPSRYKTIKYRSHYITGTPKGWSTDIQGDTNLYANDYCAMNAVDAALGGLGIRGDGSAKRR